MNVTYEEVLADMQKRDRDDSTRAVAPAVAAEDAILLDNSWMTPEESTEAVIRLVKEKTGK
jgi:cytidylate kinase